MCPTCKTVRFLTWFAFLSALAAPLTAQQFEQTPPLHFSMAKGGASPLPQVLPVASSSSSNFYFSAAASTSSGGNWLAVPGGSLYTPSSLLVSVDDTVAANLAAGTYSGQVVITASGVTETVPVTLVVEPANVAFFADLPGGLTYALATGGGAGSQVIQVNGAGSGTLHWTLAATTFNGGNFLTVSATSGTAPSLVTIGVAAQNLPGAGSSPGTFVGQLVFTCSTGSVTIPVAVSVANTSFVQSNPRNFAMPQGGAAPLPQVVPVAGTNSSGFYFQASGFTATGGNWLTVSPSNTTFYTPSSPEIGVDQTVAAALPAGVYTGEVVVTPNSTGTAPAMAIPVTLTISPSTVPFFDNLPGGMNFYLPAHGANPGSQTLQIRNAGSGTLAWTAIVATSDGGNWLSISQAGGAAPSLITVQIAAQNLPGGGAAGTYSGNILFESAGSTASLPVTVSAGQTAFLPVNPINVLMPLHGEAPVIQAAAVSSTTSGFYFNTDVHAGTGGNWLTASTTSGTSYTPNAAEIGFDEAVVSTLPAGSYTGEVVFSSNSSGTAASMTLPVTLTVAASGGPFFDDLPGGLQFSLPANGASPGSQVLQVRNAGSGTLTWTVTATTADGGNWLTVSPGSGSAPSLVTVGVVSQNLPGGAAKGIYNGSLLFESASGAVSVPVTVSAGAVSFAQVNPLSFDMPANGSVPLSQSVGISSTAGSFYFDVSSSTATGGNWLSLSQTGTLYTPDAITVNVVQSVASSLAAGTYTGEVILTPHSSGTAAPTTIPVTLTISPTGAPFFDSLPGGLQFALQAKGGNPASQVFQVRNAGSGTLNWSVVATTADGGSWLTVSPATGAAPSLVSVGVLAAKLPGAAAAGTYNGNLLFKSGAETVTVPITVSAGVPSFTQVNPLSFTMPLHGIVPLPQEVPVTTETSVGFYFDLTTSSAGGGNWLQVAPAGTLYPPQSLTVSVNQAVASALPAGTYTSEIVMTPHSSGNTAAPLTIPVTLTVAQPTMPFFDNLPGGLYFSQVSTSNTQVIAIRDEGAGQLNWTATPSTSDGGNWLTISSAGGTAPSSVTVGVLPQNLPGQGAVAATYTGQVLLQSANGSVTVPVTVNTASSAFVQSNGLVFNIPPSSDSQSLTVSLASGGSLDLNATSFTGNGGNWLSISPSGSTSAPRTFTFTVNTSSLARGVYTGEALFVPTQGAAGQTVQVTLVNGTPPHSIAAAGGTPQSAAVNTAFANPLTAVVKDASGNPLTGVTVTFTAPASGAAGTFSGQTAVTETTTSSGTATSPTFTANGTAGSYQVIATVASIATPASFSLTNKAETLQSISISAPNSSLVIGNSEQFTATGTYSDGSTADLTGQVAWNSSNAQAATIDAAGLATAVARGTSDITAALGGITSNTFVLTVTNTALQFIPLSPCRIVDTRNTNGPFGGPEMGPGTTRSFTIPSGGCNIPSNAKAYSMNVTVVPNGPLSYLTAWPTGQSQPTVSTLNSDGRIKANAAIIPAGASGAVSIYVTNETEVILDVDGYFVDAGSSPSALSFYQITPCRVADTRKANGLLGGPYLSAKGTRAFPVLSSNCGIPSSALAYSLNFTAIPRSASLGYLTTWPTGQSQPVVSTLNAPTGTIVANAAVEPAGASGEISVYVTDNTDLAIDINGYFASPGSGGLSLYPVTPCRVLDTRNSSGRFSGTLAVDVATSSCSVPSVAQSYIFNATVVPPASLEYLTLWANGQTQPNVSTLNAVDGAVSSNMAIVPTTNGSIDAYASSSTQLILDISSYFAP